MKKRAWIFLSIVIALSGCATNLGDPPPSATAALPLTATPTPLLPSPTPFPQITLAPTPPASPTPPVMATPTEINLGSYKQTTPANTGFMDLKPVAVGLVISNKATVRAGPGPAYAAKSVVGEGELAAILGKNPAGDWFYVLTISDQQGWVAAAELRAVGNPGGAPVLPPQPLARLTPVAAAAISSTIKPSSAAITAALQSAANPAPTPAPSAGQSVAAIIATANNFTPVATAQSKVREMAIRPGPSTSEAAIGTVTDNQEKIAILGLDKSKMWALVKPAFSRLGWVSLDDLTLNGSLDNAPQVVTAWVNSNGIELRSGPGIYSSVVGVTAIRDLVLVLGVDETKSWALLKTFGGGGIGWGPVQFFTFSEPLVTIALAPPLPPAMAQTAPTKPATTPLVHTRPLSESKLVFELVSGGEIMVINSDGSGLRRLTQGIDPVLSPDGQTVAFTRWQGKVGSLWLINIDGTHERSILGFIQQAKGPDWSPDESKIVLNFQHEGHVDNKKVCFELRPGISPPRIPPIAFDIDTERKNNKSYLCWTMPPDPHWSLRVVNVADGKFEDLYGGQYAFRPAWDPSQPQRIVSAAGNGLLETDVAGDYHHNITNQIGDGSPVFSPDGRYLALTSGKQGGDQGYDIFRLNSDGSGRVQLTQTPLWAPVVPGNFKQWNNVAPTWSPDGSQIAFLTDRTGRWEVWVMQADGSNQHPMFSPVVSNQLDFTYNFVDERLLSWR